MKRTADQYFRINETRDTLPVDAMGKYPLTPWERKKNGEEKELSKTAEEKEKKEYLTATYWG